MFVCFFISRKCKLQPLTVFAVFLKVCKVFSDALSTLCMNPILVLSTTLNSKINVHTFKPSHWVKFLRPSVIFLMIICRAPVMPMSSLLFHKSHGDMTICSYFVQWAIRPHTFCRGIFQLYNWLNSAHVRDLWWFRPTHSRTSVNHKSRFH